LIRLTGVPVARTIPEAMRYLLRQGSEQVGYIGPRSLRRNQMMVKKLRGTFGGEKITFDAEGAILNLQELEFLPPGDLSLLLKVGMEEQRYRRQVSQYL